MSVWGLIDQETEQFQRRRIDQCRSMTKSRGCCAAMRNKIVRMVLRVFCFCCGGRHR